MEQPSQRFKPNTRVRLREGVDPGFYNGFSRVGNEGWVRRRKLDKYGYPQILVEWDRDHWAYNGQPDGWTWEGHFEAIEDNVSDEAKTPDGRSKRDEAVRDLTAHFIKGLFSIIEEEQADVTAAEEAPEPEENWQEAAQEAANAVLASPAYIVIALDEKEVEGQKVVFPQIIANSKNEQLRLICQSQLGHLLAQLQDNALERVLGKSDEA